MDEFDRAEESQSNTPRNLGEWIAYCFDRAELLVRVERDRVEINRIVSNKVDGHRIATPTSKDMVIEVAKRLAMTEDSVEVYFVAFDDVEETFDCVWMFRLYNGGGKLTDLVTHGETLELGLNGLYERAVKGFQKMRKSGKAFGHKDSKN